jgi:hypothetical protein
MPSPRRTGGPIGAAIELRSADELQLDEQDDGSIIVAQRNFDHGRTT